MDYRLISIIAYWLVSGLALAITAAIVPGFRVRGFFTAVVASLLIGLANHTVWPLLIFLTLPINILTLGLFTFVVNGAILRLVAAFMKDFEISGWMSAIFGAIILSITSGVLHYLSI